jgi:ribonuclease R
MSSPINDAAVFVTIDSSSTRDIDDAILISRNGGGFLIMVAIADPTDHVALNSPMDLQAREMAATVYARDVTKKSMLPASISQDAASLVADQERSSFVFSIHLDEQLQVVDFTPSVQTIRVSHRLSYEDLPSIAADSTHALNRQVKDSIALGNALLEGRRKNGALAIYDLQKFLMTDEEGNLLQMHSRTDTVGHVFVQEIMILTNSLLAQYLLKNDIPALYRNHLTTRGAPTTLELRESIEALLFATNSNKDFATEKLQAILCKAKYEATANGHYGLNMPVYTHGTSPLRRYPDLVNLRQLKAFLQDTHFAYKQEDLEAIAMGINETLEGRKDASRDHFKSVVSKQAEQLLTKGQLHKMDDTLLAMAIKNARDTSGVIGELLADELSLRLRNAIVADTVIDRLFLEVGQAMIPKPLSYDMSTWLYRHPMKAMHLIVHATAIGVLSDHTIESYPTAQGFAGQASVKSKAGELFSGAGANVKKKLAEQQATSNAILKALGLPVVDVVVEKPVQKPTASKMVDGNPKGTLFELCTKRKLKNPTFTFTTQGPSHKPVFRCEGKMIVNGQALYTDSGWCDTKRGAEALASKTLLEQLLDEKPTQPPVRPASASINPVGDLQECMAKSGHSAPEYQFTVKSLTPPLFEAVVSFMAGTGMATAMGEGASKAVSKKEAAQKALLAL